MDCLLLSCGNWYTMMISLVCEYEIPDIITTPMSVDEIHSIVVQNHVCDRDSLYRLMRALVTIGIFTVDMDGNFSHNVNSEKLRSNDSSCQREYCMMRASKYQYMSWHNLKYSIETGKSAHNNLFGKSLFESMGSDPNARSFFDRAMTSISRKLGANIGENHSLLFNGKNVIADIGGGSGALVQQLVEKIPSITNAIVLDIVKPDNFTTNKNVEFQYHSFFDELCTETLSYIPDVYILKYILHDWGDDDCIKILEKLSQLKKPIYIIESIIPEIPVIGNYHQLLDMQMLVCLGDGAKERTMNQYTKLVNIVGYDIVETVLTDVLDISILVCMPSTT